MRINGLLTDNLKMACFMGSQDGFMETETEEMLTLSATQDTTKSMEKYYLEPTL